MAVNPDDIADTLLDDLLDRLRAIRERIVGVLATYGAPLTHSDMRRAITEIDRLLIGWSDEGVLLTRDAVSRAASAGDNAVLDTLRAARIEVPLGYVGVSDSLLRVSQEYTASLVQDITTDARTRISQIVRRGALSGTPLNVMTDQIGRNLDMPGSAVGTIRKRATDIARTEVSRVYNTAYWEQSSEAGQRYPELRKAWSHVNDAPGLSAFQRRNSRPDHIAMDRRTTREPIPISEPFVFPDGTRMMHPHDPTAGAKHVVGCRCRMILVTPDPE